MSRTNSWGPPGVVGGGRVRGLEKLEEDWGDLHSLVSVEGGLGLVNLQCLPYLSGVVVRLVGQYSHIFEADAVPRSQCMLPNCRFFVGFGVFFESLAHRTCRFADVCGGAGSAGNFVYNSALVFFFRLVLRMDKHGPEGVEGSVEDGDSMVAENALEFFREALDIRQAYGGVGSRFFFVLVCHSFGFVRLVRHIESPVLVPVGFENRLHMFNFVFFVQRVGDVSVRSVQEGAHYRSFVVQMVI